MKKIRLLLLAMVTMMLFAGCEMLNTEEVKLRDLEFVILSQEVLPKELKEIVEERKSEPFKLTYSDADALYICIDRICQEVCCNFRYKGQMV